MRNCYVPGCNKKNQQRRPMFLPPKNIAEFEKWQKALPYSRPLRPSDLVCHLHFHEQEIKRFFKHMIQGELFQLQRERARLSENAVPSQNLPTASELPQILLGNKTEKQTKTKAKSQTSTITTTIPNKTSTEVDINGFVEEEILPDLASQAFNDLYDNVLDVKLPNTLWGVQRCPDRSRIYFSYLHMEKLQHTKLLIIDGQVAFTTYFNGKFYSKINENAKHLTTEYIGKCLAVLDKTQK